MKIQTLKKKKNSDKSQKKRTSYLFVQVRNKKFKLGLLSTKVKKKKG
jgi:hypothetical protein